DLRYRRSTQFRAHPFFSAPCENGSSPRSPVRTFRQPALFAKDNYSEARSPWSRLSSRNGRGRAARGGEIPPPGESTHHLFRIVIQALIQPHSRKNRIHMLHCRFWIKG